MRRYFVLNIAHPTESNVQSVLAEGLIIVSNEAGEDIFIFLSLKVGSDYCEITIACRRLVVSSYGN
jgi:hypothetical protein